MFHAFDNSVLCKQFFSLFDIFIDVSAWGMFYIDKASGDYIELFYVSDFITPVILC